jgi:ParB-like chromosome segregation protein Spo0J
MPEGTGPQTVPVVHRGPVTREQLEELVGPVRAILTRNRARAKNVLQRLGEKLEPPSITEAHGLTVVVDWE